MRKHFGTPKNIVLKSNHLDIFLPVTPRKWGVWIFKVHDVSWSCQPSDPPLGNLPTWSFCEGWWERERERKEGAGGRGSWQFTCCSHSRRSPSCTVCVVTVVTVCTLHFRLIVQWTCDLCRQADINVQPKNRFVNSLIIFLCSLSFFAMN